MLFVALVACSTPGALPVAASPTAPAEMSLTVSNLVAGEYADFALSGAPAGGVTELALSGYGLGAGPCPPGFGGECFEIQGPIRRLGVRAYINALGNARGAFLIPPSRAGTYVGLQAIVPGGPASLSNPAGRPVGPFGTILSLDGDDDSDGYTIEEGDCADFDAAFHPAAVDLLGDGVDNDCDDVDGADQDSDGWAAASGGGPDCDDDDPEISPAALEVCDGVDQDCDGVVDDGVTCSAIVETLGVRRWADGTAAASCEGYRHPEPGYAYAGLTGDGRYQVDPQGNGGFATWCDMTTDGGGWTLAVRITGSFATHSDPAAVGTLTSPTQPTTAKLSDAQINALRGASYIDSRVRFQCDMATVYFADDAPFNAVANNSGALDRCATTWDATVWTQSVPYHNHYGINTWQGSPCPYMIYWLNESTRVGCYGGGGAAGQDGTVWVK